MTRTEILALISKLEAEKVVANDHLLEIQLQIISLTKQLRKLK